MRTGYTKLSMERLLPDAACNHTVRLKVFAHSDSCIHD